MISEERLAALERRYTPADQQKCVVCGAPLTFSASGEGGGTRYNCSSDDASPVRSTKPLHERLDHYAGSAWRDHGIADSGVVELVQAYRELQPRAACPCFDAAAEERLREDAASFAQEAASLDTEGFTRRALDAIGAAADTEDEGA